MNWIAKYRKQRMCALTAAIVAMAWMPTALAEDSLTNLPELKKIVNGVDKKNIEHLTLADGNKQMNIALSGSKGIIEWNRFNIGSKAEVNFTGPGNWMVLNRVYDVDKKASEIYGALNGHGGTVFLVNPYGITFGPGASVDVGSLVASTMSVDYDEFYKNDKIILTNKEDVKGAVTIEDSANILARDGYVAVLARTINNKGTISAHDVAMGYGPKGSKGGNNDVELIYADKINMQVSLSGAETIKELDNQNKILLLNNTKMVSESLINNTGTIQTANKLVVGEDGEVSLSGDGGSIDMSADKVELAGKISTGKGGIINTTSQDGLQVRDPAEVNADTGTWNIQAKNVVITENPDKSEDGINPNRVSNSALSKALENTSVNIVASPVKPEYYSDIVVKKPIVKDKGQDTSLTLTAGRNIRVDADISSAKGAGALNLTLNANNQEQTNSVRNDGANIIRANINTNGGAFTTNGTHGTYFGIKRDKTDKENIGTTRSVITNGGDITLNGAEVLVATGGTVHLDAGRNGNVKIAGNVNSANAYFDGDDGQVSWIGAKAKAQAAGEKTGTKTHLAVITGALEDAVATSAIATDYTKNSQGYIGGHVVKVQTTASGTLLGKDGKPINFIRNEQGDIVLSGEPVLAEDYLPIDKKGKVSDFGFNKKGWYKIVNAHNETDVMNVRFWAWTEGDETGKIFFVQTTGENIVGDMGAATVEKNPEWFKEAHGFAFNAYTNFAPAQPDDDIGHDTTNHTEMALTVNYDSPYGGNKILYSQWNDSCDIAKNVYHYVVEEELGKTALTINGNDVDIIGQAGNLTPLQNVSVNAAGKVKFNDTFNVVDNVRVRAQGDAEVNVINAGNLISLSGNNVTLGNKLTSNAQDTDSAIEIFAQNKFVNQAGKDVMQLGTKSNSHWKVYSNTPYEDAFGDLNSENFAEWGWSGKTSTAAEGNRYIFKYTPKLTFTADDVTKVYGEEISHTGYMVENEMDGKFLNNFLDGYNVLFMNRDGMKKADTISEGYPATAEVNTYVINLINTDAAKAWEYKIVEKPGTLTIVDKTPEKTAEETEESDSPEETPQEPETPKTPEVTPQQPEKPKTPEVTPQQPEVPKTPEVTPQQPEVPKTPEVTPQEPEMPKTPEVTPQEPEMPKTPDKSAVTVPGELKPQLDAHFANTINGTASYTESDRQTAPGADRVLGLQSAELPFFREENGRVKLYGTYDVSVDPDKVKMEPTAKVLPEPDQPKNQYREYEKDLVTKAGTAKFKMTYNGSTFDIYPVDKTSKYILAAGDAAKNVEVESQALYAAFKEMGITLDDLDGVYTHFDSKKEVQSFRR